MGFRPEPILDIARGLSAVSCHKKFSLFSKRACCFARLPVRRCRMFLGLQTPCRFCSIAHTFGASIDHRQCCLQFTAAYILGNQVLVVMREMFVDRCAHCRGAGRVICPHCGGTKTMRNRPGEFHVAQMDVVDRRPKDM